MFYYKLNNKELADLSDKWENPTVDTRKYYQNVMYAYCVDEKTYNRHKADGGLCQIHDGKYYIA